MINKKFKWSGTTELKKGVANFSFLSQELTVECKDFTTALAVDHFIEFVYYQGRQDAKKSLFESLDRTKP